jgi:Asp-tRNA(Asn)/Glu-tRNA(Gln) amidotransferase A subunit family amidase
VNTDLTLADLTAQSQALAWGDSTSSELTAQVLAQIAQRNPQLNAFLHVDAEAALRDAAASDARRAAGTTFGALDGLTLAVKDNIDVAGMPTTAGMATRRGRIASADAFVVQRLRAAGMVVLGKLNMHEAALGATNDNPHYGRCEHPLRAGFTPGGSSGGSACAVAAGLCALALGTDTMGSIRIPAAYCGVVGFKASWGLVSTAGTVACCHALDHVGPLLRSRRDLMLVMPALAAFDAMCADSRDIVPRRAITRPRFVAAADVAALGATPAMAEAYTQALAALRQRGDIVTAIDLSAYDFGHARRAGLLAAEADLLVEHAEDWRGQPQNFSPELARMLVWASKQSAVALAAALRTMAQARAETARWWMHGDVMLLPTAPQAAFAFGDAVPSNQADFTAIANMAGLPALSAPLPVAAGALPLGLQAITAVGCEATLLALDLQGICSA